jgi:hypothetical protein
MEEVAVAPSGVVGEGRYVDRVVDDAGAALLRGQQGLRRSTDRVVPTPIALEEMHPVPVESTVQRRQHGGANQPGRRQPLEAGMVVDEVELVGPLEAGRHIQHRQDALVALGASQEAVAASDQPARGHRVTAREERYVVPPADQPLGQQAHHELGSAVSRRGDPHLERCDHSDSHSLNPLLPSTCDWRGVAARAAAHPGSNGRPTSPCRPCRAWRGRRPSSRASPRRAPPL